MLILSECVKHPDRGQHDPGAAWVIPAGTAPPVTCTASAVIRTAGWCRGGVIMISRATDANPAQLATAGPVPEHPVTFQH